MALYMDYHVFPSISIEDVKLAHIADRAVQDKFGVKYHQFWVNEDAGTVFCLMEGPDKETCARVHREAHGNVACALVEVESGFYELFMGAQHRTDHGLVLHPDGNVDKGHRSVVVVNIIGNTTITHTQDYHSLIFPAEPKNCVRKSIPTHNGREIKSLGEDSIVATFTHSDEALNFARHVQKVLRANDREATHSEWDITYSIGITTGQPLEEQDGLFENTLRNAHRLSLVAENREIVASRCLLERSGVSDVQNEPGLRGVGKREELFLNNFFDLTDKVFVGSDLGVSDLSQAIGLSRPQFYRKVRSLTGRSPISFLRDIKMKKALFLLWNKEKNISEIALELGYSNPSYFSKCFSEKYGFAPSKLAL
jgi:AraC-like DNA-binding protein